MNENGLERKLNKRIDDGFIELERRLNNRIDDGFSQTNEKLHLKERVFAAFKDTLVEAVVKVRTEVNLIKNKVDEMTPHMKKKKKKKKKQSRKEWGDYFYCFYITLLCLCLAWICYALWVI